MSLICSKFISSHRRCSLKTGALKNFAKFTGKHLCQSLFFNKVGGLRPPVLLKNDSAKFLRTPILQNTSGRLPLEFKNKDARKKSIDIVYSEHLHSINLEFLSLTWNTYTHQESSIFNIKKQSRERKIYVVDVFKQSYRFPTGAFF